MPYRKVIGQIVLDKCPHLRTVVTKIGQIDSVYRYYNLECIAGEPCYETLVVEDKVRLFVDVSLMYWCTKLAQERNRLIKEFFTDG